MRPYEELVQFIASLSPHDVIDFQPSEEARQRVWNLIERQKAAPLPAEEKSELDHYVEIGHLMRLDLGTLIGQPPQLLRLFHPRTDRWGGCFLLNGVRIDPAKAIGEATVKLLHLNDVSRLRERETLARTGRYYPSIAALARMKE